MSCERFDRLKNDFERLERQYAAALGRLNERRTTASASEYAALRQAADEARIDSEVARLELELHNRVHVRQR